MIVGKIKVVILLPLLLLLFFVVVVVFWGVGGEGGRGEGQIRVQTSCRGQITFLALLGVELDLSHVCEDLTTELCVLY